MGTTAELRQVPLEVQSGAVLAGRYRVQRVIGAGGMGVVVAAEHIQLAEPVALKFLLPEIEQDADAKSRFAREAWTTAKIKSEHVVRVLDVGELPSGAPFLVMEYLDGTDLATTLASQGPMPVSQAVQFMLQACEGVAEAHALGIVHRDLKPSNFFCVRRSDGVIAIKVLDFGMSKLMRRTGLGISHSITAPALIVGSPLYMSPEQMNSAKDVDVRTDIWSLGAILYELLAGACPFVAETFPELAVKIAVEAPPSLRARRDDVPRGLERVVLRCLEKDRKRRFDDVAQLAAELVEFAPARACVHAERAARVLQLQRTVSGHVPSPQLSVVRPSSPATESRRWGFGRMGLIAAGVSLIGILAAYGGSRGVPANGPRAAAAAGPSAAPVPETRQPVGEQVPGVSGAEPRKPIAEQGPAVNGVAVRAASPEPPLAAEPVPQTSKQVAELKPAASGAAQSPVPLAPLRAGDPARARKPRVRQAAVTALPPTAASVSSAQPKAAPVSKAAPGSEARATDPARAELDELGGRK